jgi:hypothetical protein
MDNPYQEIDCVISQWVERHGFTLFTHIQGHAGTFRNVYLGSADECCQIWIDPPENGAVGIHAADVESRSDEPMRADWTALIPELSSALELAVGHVHTWFARQHRGVPPSP